MRGIDLINSSGKLAAFVQVKFRIGMLYYFYSKPIYVFVNLIINSISTLVMNAISYREITYVL